MQKALARVWHRFAYMAHAGLARDIFGSATWEEPEPWAREVAEQEDAFGTIMQWLYGRIDAVGAQRAGVQGQEEAAGVQGQAAAAAAAATASV